MVFIETQLFTRRLSELAGEAAADVLIRIQEDLLANPERGDLVRGLQGVRKARVGNPQSSRGTRGGLRYFYLYLKRRQHIHLLNLIAKAHQVDLSNEERRALARLTEALKQSEGKNS